MLLDQDRGSGISQTYNSKIQSISESLKAYQRRFMIL
jgi:hypothetical protein